MKTRTGYGFWLAFVCLALVGCSERPGSATPPDSQVVSPTPAGLATLFRQECLEQRHRSWAAARVADRRRQCGPFDTGDCYARVDPEVSWKLHVVGHGDVKVALSWWTVWPGPPSGNLDCTISTQEPLGEALQSASQLVRRDDAQFNDLKDAPALPEFDRHLISWTDGMRQDGPGLELVHRVRFDQSSDDERDLPWELRLRVR